MIANKLLRCWLACLLGLACYGPTSAGAEKPVGWPLWEAYLQHFVQQDGRVIDRGNNQVTTSEGQAYSLFFALVANDRARFDGLLNWTQNNLAGGDLRRQLPAWQWGAQASGQWGVLDPNPASDADMWLAYTLLQAGTLWQEPRYASLGLSLLARIKAEEVFLLPGLGAMLLPAPAGFAIGTDTWRINPSYLTPQLLRAFAQADPAGPWQGIAGILPEMLRAASPRGFVPDWVDYQAGKGWVAASAQGQSQAAIGSYDAIRVYLWVGMLDDADPLKPLLLNAVPGMRNYLRKNFLVPMEKIHTRNGLGNGIGPPGFSAALLPYLQAFQENNLLGRQKQRLQQDNAGALAGANAQYYDQILVLFGLGAIEKRFRFDVRGQLIPAWKNTVPAP
jgi:endo-1,4-beta-D-glucanase Y